MKLSELNASAEDLSRVVELESSLDNTDYILIKITEAGLTSKADADAIAQQYADVLAQRPLWRAELNAIQEKYDDIEVGGA